MRLISPYYVVVQCMEKLDEFYPQGIKGPIVHTKSQKYLYFNGTDLENVRSGSA